MRNRYATGSGLDRGGMDHSNFHNCNTCQCRTCRSTDCPALCKSAYGCLAPTVKCSEVVEHVELEPVPDITSRIIDYEMGEMDEEDVILLFQELINNGMAWTLQGAYGRMAQVFINSGDCVMPEGGVHG